jgi:hypothetical protein
LAKVALYLAEMKELLAGVDLDETSGETHVFRDDYHRLKEINQMKLLEKLFRAVRLRANDCLKLKFLPVSLTPLCKILLFISFGLVYCNNLR